MYKYFNKLVNKIENYEFCNLIKHIAINYKKYIIITNHQI